MVEIDIAEFKKIYKEWRSVIYAEEVKPGYNTTPLLYSFLDYINLVVNNPSHTIEEKL